MNPVETLRITGRCFGEDCCRESSLDLSRMAVKHSALFFVVTLDHKQYVELVPVGAKWCHNGSDTIPLTVHSSGAVEWSIDEGPCAYVRKIEIQFSSINPKTIRVCIKGL